MEKTNSAYCRLCAELKSFSKLIRFHEEKSNKTVEKLTRLNILVDFRYHEQYLPKTVCQMCIENLDKAFEFVVGVEKAQSFLSNIFLENQIKVEKCSTEDENQSNEIVDTQTEDNVFVKQECNIQSLDDSSNITSEEFSKESKTNVLQSLQVTSLKYLKLTWNDYLWTCAQCETQFVTLEELKLHSLKYHQCCNAFKCSECNLRTLHLKRFIVHVKRHRTYLRLSCYKCNKKFKFVRQLHTHMRSSHGPKTKYFCVGCEAEFQSSDELNEHIRTFYNDRKNRVRKIPISLKSVNSLTCVICNKIFKTKGTLNTHLLIHTDRKREHTCEQCGKCFLNKQNLAGHMLMHNNFRPYKCEICKCSFKTSKHLKSHVGIHNGEKPYTCDQCGHGFRLERYLNQHKIIHTDSLPYACSYCNKKFRFKSILNQHLRQHTGVKPYSCDICKRDFTNWPNYNKHMKRRHGLDMAKKKRTHEGIYPINPSTGEIIRYDKTNETLEWKNQILQRKKRSSLKTSLQESTTLKSVKKDNINIKLDSS